MATKELDLPGSVKETLDTLVKTLAKQLEDVLVSALVFGSAARGNYKAGESDVDLCVVLSKSSPEVLKKCANALVLARNAARIEAVLLRTDELQRAADAFPIFYDDIKRSHVVLHGSDPFATLEIAPEHKRLRVEQELREAQIRLRRAVIDSLFAERAVRGAVERKLRQVRSPLRALFELLSGDAPEELAPLLELAEKRWKLELGALRQPRNAEDSLAALNTLLDHAVDEVDRLGAAR